MARTLATATHCAHGHEWTSETTLCNSRGYRFCLICKSERDAKSAKRRDYGARISDPVQVASYRALHEAGELDGELMRLAGFKLTAA